MTDEPDREPRDDAPVTPPLTPPAGMPPYDQPLVDSGSPEPSGAPWPGYPPPGYPQPGYPQPGYPSPGYQGHPPAGPGTPGYGAPGSGAAGLGPGYGTPPAPPPKKSNRGAWTIVLIVVGSLLVLCCLGGGLGGYFIYQAVKNTTNAATDATRSFIGDLESGNANDAYSRLCSSTKSSFPQAVFASIVRSEPQITGYKITNRRVRNTNGAQTASITADLMRASGAVDRHTFPLKRENGNWLVCGQPY